MRNREEHPEERAIGVTTVLVHLGLAVCGIAALLTGLLADDYKRMEHLGFTVHSWIGMAGAFIVCCGGEVAAKEPGDWPRGIVLLE